MSLADQIIDNLAAQHDHLADRVAGLGDAELNRTSGAVDWQIHDVLSHLGSGAEIMLGTVRASAGEAGTSIDNQSVWDRWNAMTAREHADGFIRHDAALVAALQAFDSDQRKTLHFELGFIPNPVPLEVLAGLRLNEVSLHTWDVREGLEAPATVDPGAADLLLQLFAGPLGFMLGFLGKADLVEPSVVELAGYSLAIRDAVSLEAGRPDAPDATFSGAPEAAIRLIGGRLRSDVTPEDVKVSGSVTLDDLRRVFPGF